MMIEQVLHMPLSFVTANPQLFYSDFAAHPRNQRIQLARISCARSGLRTFCQLLPRKRQYANVPDGGEESCRFDPECDIRCQRLEFVTWSLQSRSQLGVRLMAADTGGMQLH